MKKTTLVSLLVAGLLISPAVLAQHVQADQVSRTTTEETVTPPATSSEVTETVTSTQGDNKETVQPAKVEEVSETNRPTTSPTAPTTELQEEPASSPAVVSAPTVESTLANQSSPAQMCIRDSLNPLLLQKLRQQVMIWQKSQVAPLQRIRPLKS